MNYKQKLGYMALGAGILALGIIIGQWGTPDIEAQSDGEFDKIICRELQVVDQDGKKTIVLQSNEDDNQVIVYEPQNKRANVVGVELVSSDFINEIKIRDKTHNISGIWLFSWEMFGGENRVKVYQSNKTAGKRVELTASDTHRGVYITDSIVLESSNTQNIISVRDVKEVPNRDAFVIFSNDEGNSASRWIRGRGRKANW